MKSFIIFQLFLLKASFCPCQLSYRMLGIYDPNADVENLEDLWNGFKDKFNKTYSDYHDPFKKAAYLSNLEKIKKHNEEAEKGVHSYFLKDNHLADMTTSTYRKTMVKLTHSRHRKVDSETVGDWFHMVHNIPDEINWIEKGFVTPTYNQKSCGSCYAFSIAGVLQAQVFKETERLVPLSEQQIVDCSVTYGNYGCGGGSLRNTLKYLDKAGGIMAFVDYPYMAKQQKCHFNKRLAIANISTWAILPARDERTLEIAVAKIGPIAASINASPHTFQLYHRGIYDDVKCTSNTVNHAMLIVGYTKDAWILKNWWGKHWGENGYMRLKKYKNRCGIANFAAYALV